jgi:hypothetical protein
MRSHPQLPLTTPGVDLEKIIRKGKTPQEGTLAFELGDSSNFHNLPSETPVTVFVYLVIPSTRVSKTLNFEIFPADFSSPGLFLEGESLDTPISHEFVPWLKPNTLGDFLTHGFTTPHLVRFVAAKTSIYVSSPTFFSNTQLFPFSPRSTIPASHVQYSLMVLPQPMNALPTTDYLKRIPQFTR